MKRLIIYCFVFAWVFTACEDVYIPDIDDVGNVIVVDARIVKGSNENFIVLTQSQGFNKTFSEYPAASGGKVTLVDNDGNAYGLPEQEPGKFYVNIDLVEDGEYKIVINHGENVFESGFERVLVAPDIDTVYGIPEVKILEVAGANDADDIRGVEGVQLYADMSSTEESPNYRFTAYNVLEYIWVETAGMFEIMHYYWKKSEAGGIFNIAAPPEYSSSKDIVKHPLFFMPKSVSLESDSIMVGWLLVLYQHGISEPAYNYYNDLNSQLDSEGRIFDPVYVQARSNLKCVNNEDAIILGNFEISNITEHRYFIKYISKKQGYRVEKISNRSPIPWQGETIDVPPDFWVH